MRAIWKGAVAFGLVNVPVKLYAATGERGVALHQVHADDGGRIRYRKVCSVCGEEVAAGNIARGYESGDGRMVVLTDEDLDQLPIATEREIAVEEFVPADQVDPIMLGKTYFLEPETSAAKPYALLREALRQTDRMAVVKVALRQRESMAVLRVREGVICLQTLLWPDEVREADFPVLENEVTVRPQELTMASSLIESLAADFDPSEFEDSYRTALEQTIEAKLSSGSAVRPEAGHEEDTGEDAEVVDLLSALQRSVEKARGSRSASKDTSGGGTKAGSAKGGSTKSAEAKSTGAKGTRSTAGAAKSTRTRKGSATSTGGKEGAGSTGGSGKGAAPKKRAARTKAS